MVKKGYDFGGWLTKYGIKCSDERTIQHGAFKDANGKRVPLVFNHEHDLHSVIGHCDLEERPEGVYCWGSINEELEDGKYAKSLIKHGDLVGLSVYANKLTQAGKTVTHGRIIEASLVLAGANPGAYIDNVMCHSDDPDDNDGAIIQFVEYTSPNIDLEHSDSDENTKKETTNMAEQAQEKENGKTVQEIVDTMSDEQKNAMYVLVEAAYQEGVNEAKNVKHSEDLEENNSEEETEEMQHNVFENGQNQEDVLKHAEGLDTIIKDGKRLGSLKESYLAHKAEYGIDNIDYLFPEAKNVTNTPIMIDRPQGWVSKVLGSVHHVPYSNIKSLYADITEDEARAKGYMKGNLKKEEVFSLLKRKTSPTTVYKKQKMDKDDIKDITDFNVVTWLKSEMRGKLDEELARAFLFGDGRLASSDDKIDETRIRPIVTAESLFAITKTVSGADADAKASDFIDKCIEAQEDYQGSGAVTAYMRTSYVTKCLLLKDKDGHRFYKSLTELATAINVDSIVKVPDSIMPEKLISINVDLHDYYVGADKGGSVDMFEDFDIDYNQEKYLIETRCSGTLVLPKSAMIIKEA